MTSLINRIADKGLASLAEACFPECDSEAPDFKQTEMVARTHEYLALLPKEQQRLLTALFVLVELGSPVLTKTGRRFSKLPVAQRTAAINAWRASTFSGHRMVGDAVKGLMTMMYMSHPDVMQHVGEFRVCEHPDDGTGIRTRADELEHHRSLSQIPAAPSDGGEA